MTSPYLETVALGFGRRRQVGPNKKVFLHRIQDAIHLSHSFPRLGGDFYVATPSRDMLLAMTTAPEPFIDKLKGRIDIDFARLPYPITNRLFYVTRDGVAGTKAA